jgi:Flp pilus assembly protein TadG
MLAAALHFDGPEPVEHSGTGRDAAGEPIIMDQVFETRRWDLLLRDQAAQIVEFAVSLPLLVLFVIGIFDFSNAITLKQKLTNAAREGARVAASDPAADLNNTAAFPVSVADAFYVVDRYLLSEKINDCGLYTQPPSAPSGPLTWTATAIGSGCAGSGLKLTIQRGCVASESLSTGTTYAVSSCVTIQYPYTWQFTSASGFFGGLVLPTNITTTATAYNEN